MPETVLGGSGAGEMKMSQTEGTISVDFSFKSILFVGPVSLLIVFKLIKDLAHV